MAADRARTWTLGVLAAGCVALQFGGTLVGSAAALGLWLAALALFHRPLLRRLWLPRFWLAGLVLAAASALLFEPRDVDWGGLAVSSRGLRAGALMLLRGTFVFGLALVASRALGGEGWLRVCRRLRAERVGTAVRAAFDVLPELQQEFRKARAAAAGAEPGRRGRTARLRETAVRFVVHVARLADRLARDTPAAPGAAHG